MPSGFYVVKLKSRVPVDEKKFQEEKSAFAEKLTSQKKQEFFSKFIEELRKDAQLYK
jgi:parvulin-like peptidyl-prolyl isomerase